MTGLTIKAYPRSEDPVISRGTLLSTDPEHPTAVHVDEERFRALLEGGWLEPDRGTRA